MRLGLIGGTFDPIHLGHLIVAEEARACVPLDEVWCIPTGWPWMKEGCYLSPGFHRNAMVELAIASNPFFRASTLELSRPGNTYTVDTLKQIAAQVGPGTELFFILGVDSLAQFPRWRRPECILALCSLVVVPRPGHAAYDPAVLDGLGTAATERVMWMEGPHSEISSSDIRQRVREGRSIKYRVPEAVEEYIYRHGLYRGEGHVQD